jgi:hypothetical protein
VSDCASRGNNGLKAQQPDVGHFPCRESMNSTHFSATMAAAPEKAAAQPPTIGSGGSDQRTLADESGPLTHLADWHQFTDFKEK